MIQFGMQLNYYQTRIGYPQLLCMRSKSYSQGIYKSINGSLCHILLVATVTRMGQLFIKELPIGKSSKMIVGIIHHFHGISYKMEFPLLS